MNEARNTNESLKRLNISLEEKLTDQLIAKRTSDNVELVELRRTMVECEMELHELREQYLTLKAKAEDDLNIKHKKIGAQIKFTNKMEFYFYLCFDFLFEIFFNLDELTQIVNDEINKNANLSKDLQTLKNATSTIETVQKENYQEKVFSKLYF